MARARRPIPLALTALLTLALLPACSSAEKVPPPAPSASAPETTKAAVPPGETIAARVMPYAKRKASMPSGMPIEIPVIDGSVISTSAPVSDSSWIYTLETTGTVESVGDWYQRAYAAASWRTIEYRSDSDGVTIALAKHIAQTVLRLRPVGVGRVEVRASIGVGQSAPTTD